MLLLAAMIGCIVIAMKTPAPITTEPGSGNGHPIEPETIPPAITVKKIHVHEEEEEIL
jgi:hypothetical protein